MSRLLLAAALAGGATLGQAAPAEAACYGTVNTVLLCATISPLGGTYYEDCVYVGSPPCTPVSVPGPRVTGCGGSVLGDPIQMRCDIG